MKRIVLILLSLTILLCCCKRSGNNSQAERATVSNDINGMLAALADSITKNGFAGWIGFLDDSKEFKWVSWGSTRSYDSLVVRLRLGDRSFHFFAVHWDSVRIEPLSANEATLFAICSQSAVDASGQEATLALDVIANLRKIDRYWKFHSCSMSEHDQWDKSHNVARADTSEHLASSIDSLVKASLSHNHQSGAVLDVDDRVENASYRVYQSMGYIFEDPRHQLKHSYIVAIYTCDDNGDTIYDSSSVGIVRDNRLIWCSRPLIRDAHMAPLPGFGDLNNDGTTDILCTTPIDMRGYGEALWIISPDSSGGKLLNSVDEQGQSTIVGASGTFKITQPAQGSAKVISVNDFSGNVKSMFEYAWNGSVFAKAKSTGGGSRH
jgi:hypothetical protein